MNEDAQNAMRAQIDEEYQRAKAQLDEERARRHKLLDELFAPWLRTSELEPAPSTQLSVTAQQSVPETNGSSISDDNLEDGDFLQGDTLRGRIRSTIQEMGESADIYLAKAYRLLIRKHPEVEERKASTVKAQISTVLTKLHQKGELRLVKKGSGGVPNIYRKPKTNNESNSNNGATAALVESVA